MQQQKARLAATAWEADKHTHSQSGKVAIKGGSDTADTLSAPATFFHLHLVPAIRNACAAGGAQPCHILMCLHCLIACLAVCAA
jgi:hypothetical protein